MYTNTYHILNSTFHPVQSYKQGTWVVFFSEGGFPRLSFLGNSLALRQPVSMEAKTRATYTVCMYIHTMYMYMYMYMNMICIKICIRICICIWRYLSGFRASASEVIKSVLINSGSEYLRVAAAEVSAELKAPKISDAKARDTNGFWYFLNKRNTKENMCGYGWYWS